MEPSLPKESIYYNPPPPAWLENSQDLNSDSSSTSKSDSEQIIPDDINPFKEQVLNQKKRLNGWEKQLGYLGQKRIKQIDDLNTQPPILNKGKLFFYRIFSYLKKSFMKGPLRVFSILHNQTLMNLEHRGTHEAGSFNFIQKKLFKRLLKDEMNLAREQDAPQESIYKQLYQELSQLQSIEYSYFAGKNKTAKSHFNKMKVLKEGECLWIDASSIHGRHSMKAMIKKTGDATYDFYFVNTGVCVDQQPKFHPKLEDKNKYQTVKDKYQTVAVWENLSEANLSLNFFKKFVGAQFAKAPKQKTQGKEKEGIARSQIENESAINKIYDVLKLLPDPVTKDYSPRSPFWNILQLGLSCTPTSFWALFKIRNYALYKNLKVDSRLDSLHHVAKKILSGKKTSHSYISYGQDLINKLQKKHVKIGVVERVSLKELSSRINPNEAQECVKIIPQHQDEIDLSACPAEIIMQQIQFADRNTSSTFTINGYLQPIEGNPSLHLAYDESKDLIPQLHSIAYLLYHSIGTHDEEMQQQYLSEIVKLIKGKTLNDLQTLSNQNQLAIVAQLCVDLGPKIYNFDSSRLGIVKAALFCALSILMARVLKTYPNHNKEIIATIDEMIRNFFPDIKQASLNLSALEYTQNWGETLKAVMIHLAELDRQECLQQTLDFKNLPSKKVFFLDASNFYGNKIEGTLRKINKSHTQITLECGEKTLTWTIPSHKIEDEAFFKEIWKTKLVKPESEDVSELPICHYFNSLLKKSEEVA